MDVSELAAALVKGFSEALGRQAYVSGYGEQELEAASKLREKYLIQSGYSGGRLDAGVQGGCEVR